MSTCTTWRTLTGVEQNISVRDSSQGGRSSDSFRCVEFESLLPQATSAALATAALFVASHAMEQGKRGASESDAVASIEPASKREI